MADEGGPGKAEMQELFRRLRNISANRVCFDCNTKNPTWASVTYGVFICIDCSAVHRSLGVHLSFVRSTQLDTTWTFTQLRNMQLGGNANASAFFSQHNCDTTDAQQKYNSRAAHLYREKLNQIVAKYNKIHGSTVLQLEDEHSKSPTEKDSDFFNEMHSAHDGLSTLTLDNSTRLTKNDRFGSEDASVMKEGPNVSAALSAPVADTGVRKSTIGQRKPASKLGAKKGGLGAQKVKADFSEIEKEAHLLDQMKEKREEDAKLDAERRAQDQEKQMATMRLAYQDLSKQQRQREEQLKHMDPKKAEQVERLGMGLGVRAGVSHSAISDMQTFEQDTPAYGSSKHNLHRKTDSFFDDFEIVESSSSGLGSMGGFSSKKNNSEWDFERPARSKPVDEDIINNRPRPSSYKASSSNSGAGDEAQKKFGNAKAISSDQFFGGSKDMESERRSNLSRFDGQTSISSADYFGDGAQRNMQQQSGFQNSLQNVDLDDVKESVRQGVTKVAGKLSNLANGMMSSIQEKYGY